MDVSGIQTICSVMRGDVPAFHIHIAADIRDVTYTYARLFVIYMFFLWHVYLTMSCSLRTEYLLYGVGVGSGSIGRFSHTAL